MIRTGSTSDANAICNLFYRNIEKEKYYISHGEIQMGVALDPLRLSDRYRDIWNKYLHGHLTSPHSMVMLYIGHQNALSGFQINRIGTDHSHVFGVVEDIVVSEKCRRRGVGEELLNASLNWFKTKQVSQVFLESGINNRKAHDYFTTHNFKPVSSTFLINLT